VWVHDIEGKRYLAFVPDNKIYQSIINTEQPDIIQLEYLKMLLGGLYLNDKAPENILLVGLGGGTIAKAINTFLPQAKLDIVEINPLIPPITKRYFSFEPNNNTKIFVMDGYLFIKNAQAKKYDLIILDAFNKDYIPPSFLTPELVDNVKKSLKPNGVVAVNTFEESQFHDTENKLYKDTFGSFFNITNGDNRIILAKVGPLPRLEQIKARAQNWAFSLARVGIDTKWLVEKFSQPQ